MRRLIALVTLAAAGCSQAVPGGSDKASPDAGDAGTLSVGLADAGVDAGADAGPADAGCDGILGFCPTGTYCDGTTSTCRPGCDDPSQCALPATACVSHVCVCPDGGAQCGASCADLANDAANCGSCGRACPPLAYCAGGACACPSQAPVLCEADAGADAGPGLCSDTRTDAMNCQGCGVACDAAFHQICDPVNGCCSPPGAGCDVRAGKYCCGNNAFQCGYVDGGEQGICCLVGTDTGTTVPPAGASYACPALPCCPGTVCCFTSDMGYHGCYPPSACG